MNRDRENPIGLLLRDPAEVARRCVEEDRLVSLVVANNAVQGAMG